MFGSITDEIENFIESEGRDLKFKIYDTIHLNFDCTPSISYDYLLLDKNNEFSFFNPEINKTSSEEFPGLSDCQIYFSRIKDICTRDFNKLKDDTRYFETISANKKLKEVADFIFSKKLTPEQIPQFIEIRLYTNKETNKAPRVFGFIGNASIIYILCYDPFHKIYSSTGKI